MPYDPKAVANAALDVADVMGLGLSNLSLNKIVFFSHAHFLTKLDMPLVNQSFEAWKFGPVLSDIYHTFKFAGDDQIKSRAEFFDFRTGKKLLAKCQFTNLEASVFHELIGFYGRIPASKLVEMSHIDGGPWEVAWNHDTLSNPGMLISDSAIRSFFQTPWLSKGGVIGRA
jgi:uncharacterized phage-associated protein